jgi:hypothetical protein
VNFTGDIGKVFGCLATNLGTSGCGLEHQLQAFQWAFDAVDHPTTQVANFIRPDAFLGLVFLTDEDDCSGYRYDTQSNAPVQNGMFMSTLPGLSGESASLRCSTRAFTCSGRNLTVTPPGYPTTGAFHDLFKNCQPRTDFCDASVDTSQPTSCNPLADYVDIANSIKAVKNDDSKILVAGIFGYPKKGDMDTAPFIIDETPNPFAAPGTSSPTQTFDYWPVCFDAAHVPPAGTYTADAAGWGATGGLRNSAFVDQFSNGLKYSICESDFSAAMADIGMTILTKLQNLCIDYKLVDTDLTTAGIQADCHVTDQVPDGNSLGYIESPDSIPRCDQANGQLPCWQVTQDATKCSVGSTIPASVAGQLVDVQRPKGFVVAPGTIVKMQCRVCPETTAGVPVQDGCNYSP